MALLQKRRDIAWVINRQANTTSFTNYVTAMVASNELLSG
jgi:hypothetical protein